MLNYQYFNKSSHYTYKYTLIISIFVKIANLFVLLSLHFYYRFVIWQILS
nr:MAG TPA: hypothetical protein [Caudoviricetes sp.]